MKPAGFFKEIPKPEGAKQGREAVEEFVKWLGIEGDLAKTMTDTIIRNARIAQFNRIHDLNNKPIEELEEELTDKEVNDEGNKP